MPVKLISDYLAAAESSAAPELAANMLLAEANHRIANNLSLIAGFVELRANRVEEDETFTGEEVRLMLHEVGTRIHTVGRLHRLLAEGGQSAVLDLHEYLHEIATVAIGAMSPDGKITLGPMAPGACQIRAKQALPVGVIVGELVTNAVKYSHPARVSGRISVTCEARPGGAALIMVSDDGVGLREGFDPLRDGGLGMRMVRNLAKEIGATVTFDSSDSGLTVRVLAPPCGPVEAPNS